MQVRRVVTGHNAEGKAVVLFDDIQQGASPRPGATGQVIWSSQGFPVVQDEPEDRLNSAAGATLPNGTVFRVAEFAPGVPARMHRTDSLDYAVVISGELVMELDDGVEVLLKAGDVVVQRGTIHNWINRGDAPCKIAFILIDAKPVEIDGKPLGSG